MSLWTMWLDALRALLEMLSSQAGLGLGLAIVAGTILLRAVLLPISWSVAYRGCIRQKRTIKLKPALQRLKERYGDNPDVYMAAQTVVLHYLVGRRIRMGTLKI